MRKWNGYWKQEPLMGCPNRRRIDKKQRVERDSANILFDPKREGPPTIVIVVATMSVTVRPFGRLDCYIRVEWMVVEMNYW